MPAITSNTFSIVSLSNPSQTLGDVGDSVKSTEVYRDMSDKNGELIFSYTVQAVQAIKSTSNMLIFQRLNVSIGTMLDVK
jgi:hypothetical protein